MSGAVKDQGWRAADRAIRAAAREASPSWLPPMHDEEIRRIWLRITGEWLENGLAGVAGERIRDTIGKLEILLARERGRSRTRHRSYDVNRHIAYCQALRALRRRLAEDVPPATKGAS